MEPEGLAVITAPSSADSPLSLARKEANGVTMIDVFQDKVARAGRYHSPTTNTRGPHSVNAPVPSSSQKISIAHGASTSLSSSSFHPSSTLTVTRTTAASSADSMKRVSSTYGLVQPASLSEEPEQDKHHISPLSIRVAEETKHVRRKKPKTRSNFPMASLRQQPGARLASHLNYAPLSSREDPRLSAFSSLKKNPADFFDDESSSEELLDAPSIDRKKQPEPGSELEKWKNDLTTFEKAQKEKEQRLDRRDLRAEVWQRDMTEFEMDFERRAKEESQMSEDMLSDTQQDISEKMSIQKAAMAEWLQKFSEDMEDIAKLRDQNEELKLLKRVEQVKQRAQKSPNQLRKSDPQVQQHIGMMHATIYDAKKHKAQIRLSYKRASSPHMQNRQPRGATNRRLKPIHSTNTSFGSSYSDDERNTSLGPGRSLDSSFNVNELSELVMTPTPSKQNTSVFFSPSNPNNPNGTVVLHSDSESANSSMAQSDVKDPDNTTFMATPEKFGKEEDKFIKNPKNLNTALAKAKANPEKSVDLSGSISMSEDEENESFRSFSSDEDMNSEFFELVSSQGAV